eukprot:TRINITY_DN757_c0_g1_i17.p1 TRINITY_DN757_c0_g1~~TRINITY_DN757_c0_g1_i17.p1  ORF type:complete len:687 (-),score=120.94 TRINITY_DN757_c0_g1_i17:110-2170(-)
MTERSEERWPHADVLVEYLKDFSEQQRAHIQYQTSVEEVIKDKASGDFNLKLHSQANGHRNVKCNVVVMASGLHVPNMPASSVAGLDLTMGYEDLPTDSRVFQERTVLVLGTGNSAFEAVDSLAPWVNYVHMMNPRFTPITPSWETRYVGSPRALNIGALDAYLLKSLDGGLGNPFGVRLSLHACDYASGSPSLPNSLEDTGRVQRDQVQPGGKSERICLLASQPDDTVFLRATDTVVKSEWGQEVLRKLGDSVSMDRGVQEYMRNPIYRVSKSSSKINAMDVVSDPLHVLRIHRDNVTRDNINDLVQLASTTGSPYPMVYDKVVRCLGWRHNISMYDSASTPILQPNKKYAVMTSEYESVNVPGMYFAGTLSHGKDFRRSAGGFIHGFRYTARALFRVLEAKYQQVRWPAKHTLACEVQGLDTAVDWILSRINTASGPYQMVGNLGDGVVLHKNGSIVCMEELPTEYFHQKFVNESRIFWNFAYYKQKQPLAESITKGTKFEIHLWHITAGDYTREMVRLIETFQTDWDTPHHRHTIRSLLAAKVAAVAKTQCSEDVGKIAKARQNFLRRDQLICTPGESCSVLRGPGLVKGAWDASEVDLMITNLLQEPVELRSQTDRVPLEPGASKVLLAHHGDLWMSMAAGRKLPYSHFVDIANGKVQDMVIGDMNGLGEKKQCDAGYENVN